MSTCSASRVSGQATEGRSKLSPGKPLVSFWLSTERTAIRSTFDHALEQLSKNARDKRDADLVALIAQRMLQSSFTDEAAHRALMRVYATQGRISLAIDQYDACCGAIRDARGVHPDEETSCLIETIRRNSSARSRVAENSAASDRILERDGRITLLINPLMPDNPKLRQFNISFTSELVTALSRFKWIAILRATESTSPITSPSQTSPKISAPTASYELSWTLRRKQEAVRILVEILEARSSQVVWADSFVSTPEDSNDFDEAIVSRITSSIDGQLRLHELKNVVKKDVRDLGAHGMVLKAITLMHELTEDKFREARVFLRKALELDRTYSAAYTWWAFWEIFNIGQGWKIEENGTNLTARDIALEAIKLDPNDALALVIAGHFDAFIEMKLERAVGQIEKSLALNPNSSFALMLGSNTYSYMGNPAKAIQMLDKSQELCPIEPYYGWMYNTSRCIAYTFAREYKSAVEWGRRSVRVWPNFSNGYKPLISSLGHLGQKSEAQEYLSRLLELEPGFSINSFVSCYPFRRVSDRDNYVEGLRFAGVPD